jgi:hypothetical protein
LLRLHRETPIHELLPAIFQRALCETEGFASHGFQLPRLDYHVRIVWPRAVDGVLRYPPCIILITSGRWPRVLQPRIETIVVLNQRSCGGASYYPPVGTQIAEGVHEVGRWWWWWPRRLVGGETGQSTAAVSAPTALLSTPIRLIDMVSHAHAWRLLMSLFGQWKRQ